jgi:hypothetical protein
MPDDQNPEVWRGRHVLLKPIRDFSEICEGRLFFAVPWEPKDFDYSPLDDDVKPDHTVGN